MTEESFEKEDVGNVARKKLKKKDFERKEESKFKQDSSLHNIIFNYFLLVFVLWSLFNQGLSFFFPTS